MRVLIVLLGVLFGFWAGWINAHVTVAGECSRLGAFFVGNKVFECKIKEELK